MRARSNNGRSVVPVLSDMRALAAPTRGAIAVVTEHLEAGWEAFALEPREEHVSAGPGASHPRPPTADMIQGHEVRLSFTAAGTVHCAGAVVGQGFDVRVPEASN